MRRVRLVLAALLLAPVAATAVPQAASAQIQLSSPWKLIRAGEVRKVGKGPLRVTVFGDWNRLNQQDLRRNESWTQHGTGLDDLSFYAAIEKGKTLFRQRDKKKAPLPKYDPAMLPTDIAEWFESSARIVLGGSLFEVTAVRPARLAGHDGVEMDFSYATEGDNLERRGIARAATIGNRLYIISFDAPKLHYFEAGLPAALAIMNSAQVTPKS